MKVFPFQIPKSPAENLIVQIDRETGFYGKLHQHEEIQISYIVQGRGKLVVADSVHSYGIGDFFVIGSNMPHVFQSIEMETSHMISLFFSKRSFGEDFFELPDLAEIKSFFEQSDVGFRLTESAAEIGKLMLQFPHLDKFSRFVKFLELLRTLCHAEKQSLAGFIYQKKITNDDGQRLRAIFDYTMKNFHKEITLKKIARLAYMTPNAFCRFFKQRTNKTFFEFLIEVRIAHACQLLQEDSDLTIATIAETSGFSSLSNFNRKFKKLKTVTPSQFVKKNRALKQV